MRAGERLFLVMIASVVVATLGWDIADYRHGWRVLGFPASLGIVVVVLCAIHALGNRAAARAADEPSSQLSLGKAVGLGAGFIVVLPMVMVCGFKIGLPAFAALYVRMRGEGWRTAAVVGAVSLAAVLLFVQLLGMPEPPGLLPWP